METTYRNLANYGKCQIIPFVSRKELDKKKEERIIKEAAPNTIITVIQAWILNKTVPCNIVKLANGAYYILHNDIFNTYEGLLGIEIKPVNHTFLGFVLPDNVLINDIQGVI